MHEGPDEGTGGEGREREREMGTLDSFSSPVITVTLLWWETRGGAAMDGPGAQR